MQTASQMNDRRGVSPPDRTRLTGRLANLIRLRSLSYVSAAIAIEAAAGPILAAVATTLELCAADVFAAVAVGTGGFTGDNATNDEGADPDRDVTASI